MGLFSTTALGITYNVTQDRLNSSYIVTKNGDTSSFMARGTTGTGAYCRTSINNSSNERVKLTAYVQKVSKSGAVVSKSQVDDIVDPAGSIATGNLARSSSSTSYNYRHLADAYTYNANAYNVKADAYSYTAKQTN